MKCIVTFIDVRIIDPPPCLIGINLHRGFREKLYPEGLLKYKAIILQILWMATYFMPR